MEKNIEVLNDYIKLCWAGCHTQLGIKRHQLPSHSITQTLLIYGRTSEKKPRRGENSIVTLTVAKNSKLM